MSNRSRRTAAHRRGHSSCLQLNVPPSPEGVLEGPTAPPVRHARLEHLIAEELDSLIRDRLRDPRVEGVRVVAVELSVDGAHARAAYVVDGPLGEEARRREESRLGLQRAAGFLRAALLDQLALKRPPKLSFAFVGMAAPAEGGAACE